ncbi:MAG: His-Xaa-Ser system radical SAM maturase HxsB [Candidatus Omnitrophica bacterium]|nr:His-Xaa-Ser system radical SAM maturase HxsB [Candidatus Omnitrophota bacterium]
MARINEHVILPFNSAKVRDKYVVSNMMGAWDVLEPSEFRALSTMVIDPKSVLGQRLQKHGVVVDQENLQSVIQDYKNLNANLFSDAGLHIAVVTTKCNLRCRYCQANPPDGVDMTLDVAAKVLNNLFAVRNVNVSLEFQGGEPLMNWPVVKFMIENARKFNTTGKSLRISLVSNLLLLDDAKMKVLADNGVDVCTSFDGPQEIHDANRVYEGGRGTYDELIAKISRFKKKFGRDVSFLSTITKASLAHPEKIIDAYVQHGQHEICLRPVNNMGAACGTWKDVGYTPEQFCAFYAKAVDYILELNQRGVRFRERSARVILTKVLGKRDPGYVDLMNPCGAGRATVSYMPDGDCYPCDEARMQGDLFKLGNILSETYEDMVKKDNLLHLLQASCMNLWNAGSVYSPWIGCCPVVNYALQGNVIPKLHCSSVHKVTAFQFAYVFDKIVEQGPSLETFNQWVAGDSHEE